MIQEHTDPCYQPSGTYSSLQERFEFLERENRDLRAYLKAFLRATIDPDDFGRDVQAHTANPFIEYEFTAILPDEDEPSRGSGRVVTGGQVRRAMELVGYDVLKIDEPPSTIGAELTQARDLRAAILSIGAEVAELVSSIRGRAKPGSNLPAAVAEAAPLSDDVALTEIHNRARRIALEAGVPDDVFIASHRVVALMTRLGESILSDPPERCNHPDCGCDADAVCGTVVAAMDAQAAPTPEDSPTPEWDRLSARLLNNPGRTLVDFRVTWGVGAAMLSREEACKGLNESMDRVEAGLTVAGPPLSKREPVDVRELVADLEPAGVRETLAWYGEQARLARLIHSEGDKGRHALAEDGGKRALEALASFPPQQSPGGAGETALAVQSPPAEMVGVEGIARDLEDAWSTMAPTMSIGRIARDNLSAILAALRTRQETRAGGAVEDVLAERRRQLGVEGWTTEHDDSHVAGEMATAAACYAYMSALDEHARRKIANEGAPYRWPWSPEWWKPTDPRQDLVKAGALILAEIERLDRASANAAPTLTNDGKDT